MTATYTFDVFASLDGFGSHHGDWGGYWGKQGPELLEHRRALYDGDVRMVLGATTYREFVQMVGSSADGSSQYIRQLVQGFESFLAFHPATAGDDHACFGQIHAIRSFFNHIFNNGPQ